MVTVVTHGDRIISEKRDRVIKQAKLATKSADYHTFLVENWVEDNKPEEEDEKNILKMLYTVLQCGERSIKMRQTKRRQLELKATKFKKPIESEETIFDRKKRL